MFSSSFLCLPLPCFRSVSSIAMFPFCIFHCDVSILYLPLWSFHSVSSIVVFPFCVYHCQCSVRFMLSMAMFGLYLPVQYLVSVPRIRRHRCISSIAMFWFYIVDSDVFILNLALQCFHSVFVDYDVSKSSFAKRQTVAGGKEADTR